MGSISVSIGSSRWRSGVRAGTDCLERFLLGFLKQSLEAVRIARNGAITADNSLLQPSERPEQTPL